MQAPQPRNSRGIPAPRSTSIPCLGRPRGNKGFVKVDRSGGPRAATEGRLVLEVGRGSQVAQRLWLPCFVQWHRPWRFSREARLLPREPLLIWSCSERLRGHLWKLRRASVPSAPGRPLPCATCRPARVFVASTTPPPAAPQHVESNNVPMVAEERAPVTFFFLPPFAFQLLKHYVRERGTHGSDGETSICRKPAPGAPLPSGPCLRG